MSELVDGSVHLVVTSPPYANLKAYQPGNPGQLGDISDYDGFLNALDNVWTECLRVLVPGGRMCVVVGDICIARKQSGRHYVLPLSADITVRARALGFDNLTGIAWQKIANINLEASRSARFLGKPNQPGGIIKNDVEHILMLRKSGAYRKTSSAQRDTSVIVTETYARWFTHTWADVPGARHGSHPAPFPLEIPNRLIRMFSFAGDTVLHPFVGTGATMQAAIQSGRNSVGFEVEPT